MLGHRPEETIKNQPVLRRLEFCNWDFQQFHMVILTFHSKLFVIFTCPFVTGIMAPVWTMYFCIFKAKNSYKRHKSAKASLLEKMRVHLGDIEAGISDQAEYPVQIQFLFFIFSFEFLVPVPIQSSCVSCVYPLHAQNFAIVGDCMPTPFRV